MTDMTVARRGVTRAAVVRAAADVADAQGIRELTLTRVAQALGVSLPALYNHVRSHSDCTAAIAEHGLDLLTQRLREATGGAAGDVAVRTLANTWRTFAADRPGVYAAIGRQRWSGSPEQAAAAERLLALLRSVVLSYGGDAADAAHRAWALGAALHGFAASEAEGATPVGHDLDPAFAHLLELLCHGLRAATAPLPAPN